MPQPEPQCRVEMDQANGSASVTSAPVLQLLKALQLVHEQTPLKSFLFKVLPQPNEFDFKLEGKDGRRCAQTLLIPATGDYKMTFRVDDFWSVSEFALHEHLRDLAAQLVQQLKVTRVWVLWSPA